MYRKLILSLLLLFSIPAFAGNVSIKYGFGAEKLSPVSNQKLVNIGYSSGKAFCWAVNVGVYFDAGRKVTSGYVFLSAGPRITPFKWFYLENLVGIGAITKKDSLLGSNLQFTIDFGAGFIMPSSKISLGMAFKHISNAGFVMPNHGRDWWLVHMTIPI